MLLSCRCTSQITPEGNYQAINPDIRRMAAAYFTVKEGKKIETCSFRFCEECVCARPRLTSDDRSEDVGNQAASDPGDFKPVVRRSCGICSARPDRPADERSVTLENTL